MNFYHNSTINIHHPHRAHVSFRLQFAIHNPFLSYPCSLSIVQDEEEIVLEHSYFNQHSNWTEGPLCFLGCIQIYLHQTTIMTGEMAPSVKCLPIKHEGLSSDPQEPMQKSQAQLGIVHLKPKHGGKRDQLIPGAYQPVSVPDLQDQWDAMSQL